MAAPACLAWELARTRLCCQCADRSKRLRTHAMIRVFYEFLKGALNAHFWQQEFPNENYKSARVKPFPHPKQNSQIRESDTLFTPKTPQHTPAHPGTPAHHLRLRLTELHHRKIKQILKKTIVLNSVSWAVCWHRAPKYRTPY